MLLLSGNHFILNVMGPGVEEKVSSYVCPSTQEPLFTLGSGKVAELNRRIGAGELGFLSGEAVSSPLESALGTKDGNVIYAVLNGIPVLMPHAAIVNKDSTPEGISLRLPDSSYGEILDEAALYDRVAEKWAQSDTISTFGERLRPGIDISEEEIASFPEPIELWCDAHIALSAQKEAYEWISHPRGKRILQMGGHGSHAIKFLLAGALQVYLLSPSHEELRYGEMLAGKFGVSEGFVPVQGIAEQMPFADNFFDAIYAGACLHHTELEYSGPEFRRILKPGARAAFGEPRMTFWYHYGRKIFSKRGLSGAEAHVQSDRPIYQSEIDGFVASFSSYRVKGSRIFVHIPLTVLHRYFGVRYPLKMLSRVEAADFSLASMMGLEKRFAPIVSICVEK